MNGVKWVSGVDWVGWKGRVAAVEVERWVLKETKPEWVGSRKMADNNRKTADNNRKKAGSMKTADNNRKTADSRRMAGSNSHSSW